MLRILVIITLAVSLLPGFCPPAAAQPMRAIQADLDYVYDPDAAQMERNIDQFVERIVAIKPAAVFLQAFADPKGTEIASEVYFPNRIVPMRADLFARVVKELKARTDVAVYGWLPVLSYNLGDKAQLVSAWSPQSGTAEPDPKAYRRVSPFDARGIATISMIFEDMAKAAPIDGVLFHDDAMLSDYEDASPAALKAYADAGFKGSIGDLRNNPDTFKAWTAFKTDKLIALTQQLTKAMEKQRGHLLTARNIYAPVVLNNQSGDWFAQDFPKFTKAYNYTAIEAMPRMEKVADDDSAAWMRKLVSISAERGTDLSRVIFELQSVDWNLAAAGKDRAISEEMLGAQIRLLVRQGAMNIGYYPDDFVTDTPKIALLRKEFSLQPEQQTP